MTEAERPQHTVPSLGSINKDRHEAQVFRPPRVSRPSERGSWAAQRSFTSRTRAALPVRDRR